MAEVTLHDYAGFIFQELIRAREAADEYSRAVAERRAQDPVMRFFPTARFRIPKMQLTIPVVVTGARFTETVRFDLPDTDLVAFVAALANEVRTTVDLARAALRHDVDDVWSQTAQRLAGELHGRLTANPDPRFSEAIVAPLWARIFRTALEEGGLTEFYERYDPEHALLTRTTARVVDMVRQRTVVARTAIDSLLVNPETNAVKNGTGDSGVFIIHAELQEEGVSIRMVRDESTGQSHPVVEFE